MTLTELSFRPPPQVLVKADWPGNARGNHNLQLLVSILPQRWQILSWCMGGASRTNARGVKERITEIAARVNVARLTKVNLVRGSYS